MTVISKLLGDIITDPKELATATERMELLFDRSHRGLVLLNALLRQRHDLPADRIPAYKAVVEFIGFDPENILDQSPETDTLANEHVNDWLREEVQ